jgi:hypothetical protein
MADLTEQDYDQLSAYIDGMLSPSEQTALEARLEEDPDLREELDALRATVALIKGLPEMQAPRDFTLTAEMIAPRPLDSDASRGGGNIRPFPLLSLLSAAAAFVLIAVGIVLLTGDDTDDVTTDTITNEIAMQAAEPTQDVALTDVAQAMAPQPTLDAPMTNLAQTFAMPEADDAEDDMAFDADAGVPPPDIAGAADAMPVTSPTPMPTATVTVETTDEQQRSAPLAAAPTQAETAEDIPPAEPEEIEETSAEISDVPLAVGLIAAGLTLLFIAAGAFALNSSS